MILISKEMEIRWENENSIYEKEHTSLAIGIKICWKMAMYSASPRPV